MKMGLRRIQLVCVFIPSVCQGPLNFDDSVLKKKEEEGRKKGKKKIVECLESFLKGDNV